MAGLAGTERQCLGSNLRCVGEVAGKTIILLKQEEGSTTHQTKLTEQTGAAEKERKKLVRAQFGLSM